MIYIEMVYSKEMNKMEIESKNERTMKRGERAKR